MNVPAPVQGLDRIKHLEEKFVETVAHIRHGDIFQTFRNEIGMPLVLTMSVIPRERAIRPFRRQRRPEQLGLVIETRLQAGIAASVGDLDRDRFARDPVHPLPDIGSRPVRQKPHQLKVADNGAGKAAVAGGWNVKAALGELLENAARQFAHSPTSRALRNAL